MLWAKIHYLELYPGSKNIQYGIISNYSFPFINELSIFLIAKSPAVAFIALVALITFEIISYVIEQIFIQFHIISYYIYVINYWIFLN